MIIQETIFLKAHAEAPRLIISDVDATDDPLQGIQEGKLFHGYHRTCCYPPLYIFCGQHLLCARLRPANNRLEQELAEYTGSNSLRTDRNLKIPAAPPPTKKASPD